MVAICIIMHGRGAGCGRCHYFQAGAADPQPELTARHGPVVPMAWPIWFPSPVTGAHWLVCAWRVSAAAHVAAHAQWSCSKHRATPINPQFPTAKAPAGYGRPTGSCHARRPIPGSRHARQRATLVDVLRVALNVANLIIGEHIITSINPQVPTAQAPAGYGRPNGSCQTCGYLRGRFHGQWRATSADALHAALNVVNLATSEPIITSINPQVPTAKAPAGYGRPTGSCHVRRPIPGSRYARQRATLVDVLRVALNVANLATGKPIITSINPQVPTAKAPAGYGRPNGP